MHVGSMRRAVILLLVLSLFHGNVTTALECTSAVSVSDNVGITVSLWNHHENDAFKYRINLAPFARLNITVIDVPSDIWFIILQIHTFQYNATLSYDKALLDKVSNRSLFGSNIGLYLKTYDVTAPIQVFLKHNNVHNLDALLVIVTYGRNAPIPGGCNMEFDIEVSPHQKLHMENGMIVVESQPALAPNVSSAVCEKILVQYKMYRLYLPRQDFTPDTYFNAIASMLTVQDIVQNSDEIPASSFMSSMRRIYSAYTGTGSVYAVVATYENYSSAYIPIFTYACSPLLYPESCQVLNPFSMVICALVLMLGCLSIIISHKAYVDSSISNCMIYGVFGYTLGAFLGVNDSFAILIGLIFTGIISLIFHVFEIYISLWNTLLGFLCVCIVYLYAPAKMFYILEHNWLFWPMFISLMFMITTLLRISYVGEIVARAIFGSYFVIIAIDYFIGSNLKYIILTIIRRITVPEFHLAFVYPPFQSADITLIIIWIVLILARFIIQKWVSSYCNNEGVLFRTVNFGGHNTENLRLLSESDFYYDSYTLP
ncbi:transmembrane 7 superfamily member 3 [Monomorium pharaonis]|uniref:transmembrane 7 superfamily member 3 n=1 Tax=Monomorium pharaonis TaxID=307658 RepID=UPI00063F7DF6|nr:transmembrane 7 superfamily member 3 [Monomorium pharaonis]